MTNRIHMGDVPSSLRTMRNNQRQNAHIHLAHDYGYDAVKLIQNNYNLQDVLNVILMQRAEMTLGGTLYDANDKLVGKIDLARLGISPQHIAEIQVLKTAEDSKVVGAHTAAASGRTGLAGGVEGPAL